MSPFRVLTVIAAALLITVAGCVSSGETTSPSIPSEPLSPEAKLVRELGCTSCAVEVQTISGLTYEDEAIRLLISQAELEPHPATGATQTTRVFLIRDSDDELLASNLNEAPTGFVPLPPADFDDSWHLADDGTFFLLTKYSGVAGMQQVAWLRPDLPESVEGFSRTGPTTFGQKAVETEDLDGDGAPEVVGHLGDDNPEWVQRYVKFFYKFDPDSVSYQPWRCSESTDGGFSYPKPVTMYEAPCYEFGSGPLPWEEGE